MTRDTSTVGYEEYMNNLSFKGQQPGRMDRETHINILELETGKYVKILERRSKAK